MTEYERNLLWRIENYVKGEIQIYQLELENFFRKYILEPETLTKEYADEITQKWTYWQIIDFRLAREMKNMIIEKIEKMN